MKIISGEKVDFKQRKTDQARQVYLALGSIKKTAKVLGYSKHALNRLLGKEWLAEARAKRANLEIIKRLDELKTSGSRKEGLGIFGPRRKQSNNKHAPRFSESSATIHTTKRINQTVRNPNKVLQTNYGTFEIVSSSAWGHVLVPVKHPNPRSHKATLEEVNGIKLIDSFPKIPGHLWTRWIDLCFHYSSNTYQEIKTYEGWDKKTESWKNFNYVVDTGFSEANQLEVTILLCRKESDLSQWRMLVPRQSVAAAHVRADVGPCIDIETGERFEYFPPPGWLHAGSSHSHNTMDAFFSNQDDASEISVPGLHIVVGRINNSTNTYTQRASIVLRCLRKHVNFRDVVDALPVEDVTFHKDVLEYITNSPGCRTPIRSLQVEGGDEEDDDDDEEDDDVEDDWDEIERSKDVEDESKLKVNYSSKEPKFTERWLHSSGLYKWILSPEELLDEEDDIKPATELIDQDDEEWY